MPPGDIPSNGAESPRPQAGPLPSKRGEIGHIIEPPTDILHTYDLSTRPSVDRNHSPVPVSPDAVVIPPEVVTTCPSGDQLPSTASITKPNGMLDFLKPQGPPAFGGLRLYTLVIFAVQLILLGGTVIAWIFASKRLATIATEKNRASIGQPPIIPLHIIFVVVVVVQIVLLERPFFRLREERYNYVHYGEIPPRHSNIPRSSMTWLFAPWNQPSLPTYAAVLSQSGVATGDAEDHLIAVSPPPAYNNTRGSTLVLAGFPRNSLGRESGTGRPLSYVSRDEQRDQVQNAERVRRLDETMDRLEPPSAAYIAR